MATSKYKKETAENKQQTQVPAPAEGGLEDKSKTTEQVGVQAPTSPPVKLTSGAVPPEKAQAGSVPTQVNQSIPEFPLQDRGMDTQFVQNPDDVIKGPVLEPQEGMENITTNVRDMGNGGQPPAEGNPMKDRMKTDTNVGTEKGTVTGTVNTVNTTNTATEVSGAPAPLFKSDPVMQTEFENEVKSWGLNGNVDHFNRPMVTADKMRAAGYNVPDGETATIYTISFTPGEEDPNGPYEYGGKRYAHNLVMTPILKDGTVWTAQELEDYWNGLMEAADGDMEEALKIDAEELGLVVGMDTQPGVEEKIHKAHEKYYLGEKKPTVQENTKDVKASTGTQGQDDTKNNTTQGVGNGNNTDVQKDGANVGKTGKTETKEGEVLNDVKNTTSTSSVEDWKKSYSGFTKDQIETILNTNKGIPNQDPNLIKALEELYTEKGGVAETKTETVGTSNATKKEEPKKPELTEEEKAAKAKAKQDLLDRYRDSNKNLENLPVVSEAKMVKEGWVAANGKGNQVLYPQVVKIKDKNGNSHKVLMSPIMEDGSILSAEEFKNYVADLEGLELESADEILNEDKTSGCGLIIKMDATNDDLDEIDKLCEDILKGETPTEMTYEEKNKADEDEDDVLEGYTEELERARGELAKVRDKMSDPNKTYKSNFIDTIESNLKENKEQTEKAKKSQKRNRLIANIGDFLQLTFNSLGAYLGANSAELTSLSAAANDSAEKELTRLEKRRLELQESLEKAKDKVDLSDAKDLERWQKYITDLNKDIMKYKADKSKLYTQADLRDASERRKSKEQALRRVNELKLAKQKMKTQHEYDIDKIDRTTQGRIEVEKVKGGQKIAAEREHGKQSRLTKQTKSAGSSGGGGHRKKNKKGNTRGGRKSEGSWRP